MVETDVRMVRTLSAVASHLDSTGVRRGYLRYAVIGDSSARKGRFGSAAWALRLADALGGRNVMSLCDLARPGATAYEMRRAQLRSAVAHRPHLVAITPGVADIGRRDWDSEAVRAHLLHCAMVLTQHEVIVMTVPLDPRQRGIDALRPARRKRRARIEWINAVLAEINHRFGGVHIGQFGPTQSPALRSPSAAVIAQRFCAALGARGALVPLIDTHCDV